ncbi:response regulator transcription factor [Methylosinus sp. LW4]|uniref:response regulator transcription factor n=1 Tax=Methylosinus sp. LW4 TaxID=136993 RepID=UPI000369F68A|nr:response regulator transcription factor [Methylosinus sp. LW4]
MRILIVEDHAELAREIAEQLGRCGFVADRVACASEAVEAVETQNYSLMLLDRKLPDGEGISLIPAIRHARPGIRILMVTALDATCEKVSGLEAGADDYLTKPFEPDELIARIRASLRRPGCERAPPVALGFLSFDLGSLEVTVHGMPVLLHQRELALLEALVRQAGRVVLRDTLMTEVFGFSEDVHWNTLNVLVSRLRRRLAELDAGVDIHSARGVGYLMTISTP